MCLNVISSGGGSNLYEPDEFSTFSPEDIRDRIKGSKIVIVSEQVWSLLSFSRKGLTTTGNAERNLHDQSLHANHVYTSNSRPASPAHGTLPFNLRHHRLVCNRSGVLYSLSTVQRILGNATTKLPMHNAPALRHLISMLQHIVRHANAIHSPPASNTTTRPMATKSRTYPYFLHGDIRHLGCDLDEGLQSFKYL